MKTLAEINAIRDAKKAELELKDGSHTMRVVVGMATCGIAAGATPVLETIKKEVEAAGLSDKVIVSQTGCVGICQYEPVVEVYTADTRTTYIKMDADKAKEIAAKHICGGQIVTEYTIGSVNG